MDNDDQETENPGGGITNGANGANGQYQEQQVIYIVLHLHFIRVYPRVYSRCFFKTINPYGALHLRVSRVRASATKCCGEASRNCCINIGTRYGSK
jgi:hypothetical protein